MALSDWLKPTLDHWGREPSLQNSQASGLAALGSSGDPGVPVNPTARPFDGVVYITDKIGNSYYQASGVLIAPDEVLTASHVVFSTGSPIATDVEVSTGFDGRYSTANSTGIVTHYNLINDSNDNISLADTQNDYAIIHLATPFSGATVFSLMSDYTDTLPNQTGPAAVSGYPGSANGVQMYYAGKISVNPYYTVYNGGSLGPGSSGGPVWFASTDGQPTAVGLVSSHDTDNPNDTTSGNMLQITTPVLNQIEAWVTQDDGTTPALTVLDTSNNDASDPQAVAYTGPVAGLTGEYINISPDNINITANANNMFLHSGSGEDAIAALGGTNVLDGGTGSNFLVGGTGTDTFFTDDRAATASIWDTLVHFHAGDAATIFGVTQADFTFNWVNSDGATGYTGLTLHATSARAPEASVTFAGFNSNALTNGQLTISFGTVGTSPYMYVHDNG